MIKALILDLDNTIYPARAVTDQLFATIEHLMDEYKDQLGEENLKKAKEELSRTAFQKVADKYGFPEDFKKRGVAILSETVVTNQILPFEAYQTVRELPVTKYLVTFGFMKLQQSKIDCLGIRNHFKEVIVVDPEQTTETKKHVFERIMQQNGYAADELLVIGDDPESEIKAGKDLGIPTYLYDPDSRFHAGIANYYEKGFVKVKELLERQ